MDLRFFYKYLQVLVIVLCFLNSKAEDLDSYYQSLNDDVIFNSEKEAAYRQHPLLVGKDLSKLDLKELYMNHIDQVRDRPYEGVFYAPKLHSQIEMLLNRFLKSKRFKGKIAFHLTLNSSPEINANIHEFKMTQSYEDTLQTEGKAPVRDRDSSGNKGVVVKRIDNVRIINININKGLIDLITDLKLMPEFFNSLEENDFQKIKQSSLGLMAAVIAHEMGHFLNDDISKPTMTKGVFRELAADRLGVKLLDEIGYDPALMPAMLELLSYLDRNLSVDHLVSSYLANHPKPNYRISILEEIIEQVKNARDSNNPYKENSELYRNSTEKTSKATADTVRKNLNKEKYLKLSLREKLKFLESYLPLLSSHSKRNITGDSLKEIIIGYQKILPSIANIKELNLLTDSMDKVTQLYPLLSGINYSSKGKGVKAHIKELSQAITSKMIIYQRENGEMSLDSIEEWANNFDFKKVYGMLQHQMQYAQSLEELEKILFIKEDNARRIFTRLFFSHAEFDPNQFFGKMFLAHIRINGNLEQALDFSVKYMNYTTDGFKEIDAILGRLVIYVLNHDDIEWGNLLKRLSKPNSSIDREIRDRLRNVSISRKNGVENILNNKQGALKQISYGMHQRFIRTSFDLDFVRFFKLIPNIEKTMGVEIINDIIKSASLKNTAVIETLRDYHNSIRSYFIEMKQLDSKFKSWVFAPINLNQYSQSQMTESDKLEFIKMLAANEILFQKHIFDSKVVKEVDGFLSTFVGKEYISAETKDFVMSSMEQYSELLASNSVSEHTRNEIGKIRSKIYIILNVLGAKSFEEKWVDENKVFQTMRKYFYPSDDYIKQLAKLISKFWLISKKDTALIVSQKSETKFEQAISFLRSSLEEFKILAGLYNTTAKAKYDFSFTDYLKEESETKNRFNFFFKEKEKERERERESKQVRMETIDILDIQLPKDLASSYMELKDTSVVKDAIMKLIWPDSFSQSLLIKDPVLSIKWSIEYISSRTSTAVGVDEQISRTFFILASRALSYVKTKEQMDAISYYLMMFFKTGKISLDRIVFGQSFNIKDMAKVLNFEYREVFFRDYISMLNKFNSWSSSFDKSHTLENNLNAIRRNLQWSLELDEEIAEGVTSGKLLKESKRWYNFLGRDFLIEWVGEIRSPAIRDKVYRNILKERGMPKNSILSKIGNKVALLISYIEVKKIWTKETLDELLKAKGLVEQGIILAKAWNEYGKDNAIAFKKTESQAMDDLLKFNYLYNKSESPFLAEVERIFPEGGRFGDVLMEEYAQRTKTSLSKLNEIEAHKSYNKENPLHKISKAFVSLLDDNIERFETKDQMEILMYLSGAKDEIDQGIVVKYKEKFNNKKNREKAAKRYGLYLNLDESKKLFSQMHPEERFLLIQSLFVSGFQERDIVFNYLLENLLLADKSIPKYLNKLIRIQMDVANELEKKKIFSWVLANSQKGVLGGPQILRLMIEQGSVAAAKLAQLIASHGFRLPYAYQVVLEKFKAKAQSVHKMEAMNWLEERLPKDKYDQIKTLDIMYGAGSFKIAFGATLNDGRHIILMLHREYLEGKIRREFELLDHLEARIMADPELRLANLPNLFKEVKRIISIEKDTHNEARVMKSHAEAAKKRPLLVKLLANGTLSVIVPQALEGWTADGILAEEFVKAISFSDLPKTSFYGWSKKDLAQASINEIIQQITSYIYQAEHQDGKVLIDIDPHEGNQLAKTGIFGGKTSLVNIDLGQTVEVDPENIRIVIELVAHIFAGRFDEAVEKSKLIMEYEDSSNFSNIEEKLEHGTVERFSSELKKASVKYSDPIEILTASLEEMQIKGVGLKNEYIYFQKLFSTMVGLKKYTGDSAVGLRLMKSFVNVLRGEKSDEAKWLEARIRLKERKSRNDNDYMTQAIVKNMAIRSISNPIDTFNESKRLSVGTKELCRWVFSKKAKQ